MTQVSAERLVQVILREQLPGRLARELAAHTDLDDIAVLTVLVNQSLEKFLIGTRHITAVDVASDPVFLKSAEALPEPARVSRWVTESNPDDLGVLIGQRTLGDLPDDVIDT